MIAKKLAQMHKIPLTNAEQTAAPESAVFIDKTRQWLCTMPSKFESAKSQRQFDDYFADLDLSCQFASMQSALERINYPLVFSHNDLLIYNILLDDVHNEVHFIDFEYAGPNYQLFDLGNHLCEYAGIEDPDYEQDGPTEAERQLLLRRYFFQFRGQEPTADELKKVATEVMHFEAAAHFFWALWAIQQASLSQIPFDYLQYAVTRHRQFTRLRAQLDF